MSLAMSRDVVRPGWRCGPGAGPMSLAMSRDVVSPGRRRGQVAATRRQRCRAMWFCPAADMAKGCVNIAGDIARCGLPRWAMSGGLLGDVARCRKGHVAMSRDIATLSGESPGGLYRQP